MLLSQYSQQVCYCIVIVLLLSLFCSLSLRSFSSVVAYGARYLSLAIDGIESGVSRH